VAMASTDEPRARGLNFIASKRAVLDLWGDTGLADVARRLPADAKRDTLDAVVLTADQWLPERYGLAWYEAVGNGPALRLIPEFRKFIDKRIDNGFGRVRRFFLSQATPAVLVPRVPGLWRNDHTHGDLSAFLEENTLIGILRNHPFTTTTTSRLAIAE